MLHEIALRRALPGIVKTYDFSGKWKNELGSIVTLDQEGGKVMGTYTSPVSEPGRPVTGAVIGYVTGMGIVFSVQWTGLQSMTSWVGQLVPVRIGETIIPTLQALWQMVSSVHPGDEWAAINAGADVFTRP